MAGGKRRARVLVKVILAVTIPLFIFAAAFCGLAVYLQYYNDKIFPSVSIDGADLSWLTFDEASEALNLQAYDKYGTVAGAAIEFPDGSELKVTGEDIKFTHDARFLLDTAFSRGRGDGFVMDAVGFLQRMYGLYFKEAKWEAYTVSFELSTDILRSRVNAFTDSYNSVLESSSPLVYEDRVVIVKGAGQVRASESDVYELALGGLLESINGGYPVKLSYALPEAAANTAELTAIRRQLLALPLSASYDPETKTISESAVGVDFNFFAAIAVLNDTQSGKTVSFDIEYEQPEITRELLENLLFRDLIGECTTQIAGTENRLNNIILSAEAIDGLVLEPGEEFSFNQIVGKRTSARGYKSAPAFSGGQVVQAIGGGICQVSSSIYSAIKDTDILVKERHAHGRPVAYLPRGRDATVSWGTLDFRFINNTEYPLRIDVDIDGRTLTVHVFGTLNHEDKPVEAE